MKTENCSTICHVLFHSETHQSELIAFQASKDDIVKAAKELAFW